MTYYHECIQRILHEIESNLEFVTIDDLVELSGYSYYNFHRIFKAHTGENAKKYIKRLQLEKSVQKMKMDHVNTTTLAHGSGFHLPSSYNKSFKNMFHINPTEYKNLLIKQRKSYKSIESSKIETMGSFDVYALRYVGKCEYIDATFQSMIQFAINYELDYNTIFGITYEDPDITDENKLRYDVCIPKTKKINTSFNPEIYTKYIEGGKYAVFQHSGDPLELIHTYNSIFGKWLYENDVDFRNLPILQKITNYHTQAADNLRIEIYIPIS